MAAVERNRPGFVFHCEQEGCMQARGLKLAPLVVRSGVRIYRWRCEEHR